MTDNWKKFKEKKSQGGEPEGVMTYGTYMCQFCNEMVFEGKYFPVDRVLSYKCTKDHLSIVENFGYM